MDGSTLVSNREGKKTDDYFKSIKSSFQPNITSSLVPMLATTGVTPRHEIGRYIFHFEYFNDTKDCKFSEYAKFIKCIVMSREA